MTIRMDKFIRTLSTALDMVESELIGATTYHGKRIAILCVAMGRVLGLDKGGFFNLAACALLHDNALTEYVHTEYLQSVREPSMKLHCEYGERNTRSILFPDNVEGFVLYHHERADGSGPFGKKEGETPLEAELIAIADSVDVMNHLESVSPADLPVIRWHVTDNIGVRYTRRAAEAMLKVLTSETLELLRCDHIQKTTDDFIPPRCVDITDRKIYKFAEVISRIIDYKSEFTRHHSNQIANKVWIMAEHYGYEAVQRNQVYLAAVLHDIGKLATPTGILEKPARLSAEEYRVITDHVRKTQEILKEIDGMEDICAWAGNHHEKLDGSGYPRGLRGEEMDFNSRLMACLDIYEAVSEKRPYHPPRNHQETMDIINPMVQNGHLDREIMAEIDRVLAPYDGGEVPPPAI